MSCSSHDLPPDVALRDWQRACLAEGWGSLPGSERVPVTRSVGRRTATTVRARWSAPAFELAAMDGIAVQAAVLAGASPHEPVRLAPGDHDVVDTGDLLPVGRDAVVKREDVTYLDDGTVELTGPVRAGRHVRGVGEDVMAGEVLLPAGHRVRPVDAAVVAGAGHDTLEVRRRPRIAVLPTGDEVRPIGTAIAPGEVLDTNSPMLAAMAEAAGCEPVHFPVTPDDRDALVAAARAAAGQADLILVIAGSSRGRDDHTAEVIAAAGSVVVQGVAMRPGHPAVLGFIAGHPPTPVIGVPGYPVSAAHVFDTFALPLIRGLGGVTPPDPPVVRARLARAVSSQVGSEECLLVRLENVPGTDELEAVPIGRGAGALSVLMRADGRLRIPVGCPGIEAGAEVEIETVSGAPAYLSDPGPPGPGMPQPGSPATARTTLPS